jgi:hypothetical protein
MPGHGKCQACQDSLMLLDPPSNTLSMSTVACFPVNPGAPDSYIWLPHGSVNDQSVVRSQKAVCLGQRPRDLVSPPEPLKVLVFVIHCEKTRDEIVSASFQLKFSRNSMCMKLAYFVKP